MSRYNTSMFASKVKDPLHVSGMFACLDERLDWTCLFAWMASRAQAAQCLSTTSLGTGK